MQNVLIGKETKHVGVWVYNIIDVHLHYISWYVNRNAKVSVELYSEMGTLFTVSIYCDKQLSGQHCIERVTCTLHGDYHVFML